MIKAWWTCVLALAFCSTCYSVRVLYLNGEATSRTKFCIGENLTLVCNGASGTYAWTVGDIVPGNNLQVTSFAPTANAMGFTATRVSVTETRLQFEVSDILENNTVFECADAGTEVTITNLSLPLQDTPEAPMLKNIQQLLHTNNNGLLYSFDIIQSGMSSFCVYKYNINISGIGCSYTATTAADVTELNATYNTMSVGALPVCCEEYNFTVSAVDRSNRESEPTTGQHTVDFSALGSFSGTFSRNSMDMDGGYIDVTIPPVLASQVMDYFYSYENGSGRVSDGGNKFGFTSTQNTRINIMNPCMDCSIELTPIICDSRRNLTSKMFTVMIMINISATELTTSTPTGSDNGGGGESGGPSTGAIIGIAVAAGVVAIIVLIVIILIVFFLCCKSSSSKESRNRSNVEMTKQFEHKPEDNMPTYQAPETIKRETASNTGDVYTVPEKKGKQTKASRPPPDELPTYSVVDKGKKGDNLVYADLDVKNPVGGSSKRPPPPPGVTEHDANEPVLYSTVH